MNFILLYQSSLDGTGNKMNPFEKGKLKEAKKVYIGVANNMTFTTSHKSVGVWSLCYWWI